MARGSAHPAQRVPARPGRVFRPRSRHSSSLDPINAEISEPGGSASLFLELRSAEARERSWGGAAGLLPAPLFLLLFFYLCIFFFCLNLSPLGAAVSFPAAANQDRRKPPELSLGSHPKQGLAWEGSPGSLGGGGSWKSPPALAAAPSPALCAFLKPINSAHFRRPA